MGVSFSIIGGDLRNVKLAEHLAADERMVKLFGFKGIDIINGIESSSTIEEVIKDTDVVVGPIICSLDGQTLNCPYFNVKVYIDQLFRLMNKKQIFIAGKIDEQVRRLAQAFEVPCVDLLEREEMTVLNAIPTAEGAVQIALEELPVTLHSCDVLVLGFGRVGKTLARTLRGLNANVSVAARKNSDLAWIESFGYKPIRVSEIKSYMDKFSLIYNTVPHLILDTPELQLVKNDCMIIDLASKPGGVNFEKAKELGVKTIWALSLPGKVAPVSAAKFMKDTIYNIYNEITGFEIK